MSEQEVSLSIDVAKSKINVEVQRQGLFNMIEEAKTIQVDEQSLEYVAEFLKKARSLRTAVDKKHEEIKRPHIIAGRNADEAKRLVYKTIEDEIIGPVEKAYNKVCVAVQEKKKRADQERARISGIKSVIERNMISFSELIAKSSTTESILHIERLINLEKGNSKKYQEFLDTAVERYNTLTENIRDKKARIKEMEEIEKQIAIQKDEQIKEELTHKKTSIDKIMSESDMILQIESSAASADVNLSDTLALIPEEVLPEVKPRRTTWEFEVVDLAKVKKFRSHWITVEINKRAINDYMKDRIAEKGFKDGEEYTIDGVRFFQQRVY